MPAVRVIVVGHVQGVGFRAFAQRGAVALGIVGEVWNRADGSVEIIAQHHDEPVLAAYIGGLAHGPGDVQAVNAEPAPALAFPGFSIVVPRATHEPQ